MDNTTIGAVAYAAVTLIAATLYCIRSGWCSRVTGTFTMRLRTPPSQRRAGDGGDDAAAFYVPPHHPLDEPHATAATDETRRPLLRIISSG